MNVSCPRCPCHCSSTDVNHLRSQTTRTIRRNMLVIHSRASSGETSPPACGSATGTLVSHEDDRTTVVVRRVYGHTLQATASLILGKANQTLDMGCPRPRLWRRDRTGLLSKDRVHEGDRPRHLRLNGWSGGRRCSPDQIPSLRVPDSQRGGSSATFRRPARTSSRSGAHHYTEATPRRDRCTEGSS